MTEITLYNTRTRRKERLVPLDPSNVRMYVCGPTVYDRAHIGNARPVVVFDTLFRLLRHVYGEEHVTYVRNITDVDDKIIARAKETGRRIEAITEETTRWYHEDMAALGTLPPTHEPRATEWIGAMVAMIETLVAKGHAYAAEGHVMFDVRSYPEYGRLARRSLDDMRAGARVEVAPYKRDPMDFVLWKPSPPELPGWPSPWGRGRPGWHIECSAMADGILGASFDIHGGGIDLAFPHHENELAQSMCAHPEAGFASIWMHNGMLNIESEKMSKSLGNFFTVRDLLDRGIPGEVLRFVLLSTHYRQPMDWTAERVQEAMFKLRDWRSLTTNLNDPEVPPDAEFVAHLTDDLNTKAAIDRLHTLDREARFPELSSSARLVGLLTDDLAGWYMEDYYTGRTYMGYPVPAIHSRANLDAEIRYAISELLSQRFVAKRLGGYDIADAIRSYLKSVGVEVRDKKDRIEWDLNVFAFDGSAADLESRFRLFQGQLESLGPEDVP